MLQRVVILVLVQERKKRTEVRQLPPRVSASLAARTGEGAGGAERRVAARMTVRGGGVGGR